MTTPPDGIVGRDLERDLICAALARGVVVVEGDAGIGKTSLVRSVVERLSRPVLWITATEGTSDLAFGSLAAELGEAPAGEPTEVLAGVVEWLAVGPDGQRRAAVVIDDAQWLDRRSAAAVRLAASRGVPVVAVQRSGLAVAPDLLALRSTATCVVLEGLDEDALTMLATELLGERLHPASGAQLRTLSSGNPLFARELLLGSHRAEALVSTPLGWRVEFAQVPRSLQALVDERIESVPQAGRHVLELVAIAQEAPARAAFEVGGIDGVDAAEDSGLLEGGSAGRMRISHPLFAAALAARVGPHARQRILGALVRSSLAEQEHGEERLDVRLLARWALDADAALPDELVVRALRSAVDHRDDSLAVRLAELVRQRSLGPAALITGARALHLADRSHEALDLLASIEIEGREQPILAAHAAVEAEVRFWGLGDGPGAREVVAAAQAQVTDPTWSIALETAGLTYALLGGEPAVVVDRLGGLEVGGSLGYTIASVLLPARTLLGQSADARSMAAGVQRRDGDEVEGLATERTMAEAAAAFALTELGDSEAAAAMAWSARQRAVAVAAEPLQAWASLMLGRLALAAGDLPTAARWFDEVIAMSQEEGQGPGVRWGRAGSLMVSALAGDRLAAASDLAALEAHGPSGRRMMEPEVEIALAHGARLTGRDPEPHLDRAREAVRASGSLGLAPSVELAAAALGAAVQPVGAIPGAAGLLLTRASAVERLFAHDATGAAMQVDALALGGAAVDAAVVAMLAHRLEPASSARRRAAVRRRQQVPHVRLALFAALDQPALTPREHEIAALTVRGLTTAEVARLAGCSVRTVENHLHRTYQKLGIGGRADLAEALGIAHPGGSDSG